MLGQTENSPHFTETGMPATRKHDYPQSGYHAMKITDPATHDRVSLDVHSYIGDVLLPIVEDRYSRRLVSCM